MHTPMSGNTKHSWNICKSSKSQLCRTGAFCYQDPEPAVLLFISIAFFCCCLFASSFRVGTCRCLLLRVNVLLFFLVASVLGRERFNRQAVNRAERSLNCNWSVATSRLSRFLVRGLWVHFLSSSRACKGVRKRWSVIFL